MKIAIITGASSGIGREFARQLDNKGLDKIWVIARRKELLEELKRKLQTPCEVLPLDLCLQENIKSFKNKLDMEKPSVSYLVNSAGFGFLGNFQNIPIKEQLDMIDVNIRALTQITHMAIPYMSNGSNIINISSVAGFAPLGAFNVYAATKAYVTSFSIALIPELEESGIHSLAVCPGPVDTEFGGIAGTFSNRKKNIFNKMARPDDIVQKALKDAAGKKAISTYGAGISFAAVAAKLLPKRFVAVFSMRSIYRKQD